jgi:hypothetical protein
MTAGLCASLAVRFYVSQEARKDHRWNVGRPVSVLTLLFTAGMIIRLRSEPFWPLVYGTGLGLAGVQIISACLAWVKRGSDLFQPPGSPTPGGAPTLLTKPGSTRLWPTCTRSTELSR